MTRAVVNVATGRYVKGQARLNSAVRGIDGAAPCLWRDPLLPIWPTHEDIPYAFKAYALTAAAQANFDLLLWCDASIWPVRSLDPAWEKIERDGYLFMNNGYSNYEWTADSAYPDLFAPELARGAAPPDCRRLNRSIRHTVGAFFGLSMRHELGRAALAEYYHLASETRAFCGPWINANYVNSDGSRTGGPRVSPCGPSDVRGHRHDQTALSVIAWRLGMKLTDCPEFLVYGEPKDAQEDRTLVVVNGAY